MIISADHLYALLPAIYRERDAAAGGALREYLEVLTDELAVVADGIDQLHDDLFVETAAPWVLPYLADLVGLRGLPGGGTGPATPRAEVANTIAYRRRKGTAAVLEQVARDTTGWPAHAVEFFELLATTQHVNHVRRRNDATVSVRRAARMEWVGTAFERGRLTGEADLVHLPDVRRIATAGGRHNIPNVGLFLWRLRPYPVTGVRAVPAAVGDEHRFLLDPLGAPAQLFSLPVNDTEITHLAGPLDVPMPIGRRLMDADVAAYYGRGLSVHLTGPAPEVIAADVEVCDLSDVPDGSGAWAHVPVTGRRVRLDPVLGRIAFRDEQVRPPAVSYHRGFSADLGGGEYDRVGSFAVTDGVVRTVAADGSAQHTSIGAAVLALPPEGGVVEVRDSATYSEAPALTADTAVVEVRAADRRRPALILPGGADLAVTLTGGAEVSINGLLVAGGAVRVSGHGRLGLRHCTLVPGIGVGRTGDPLHPGKPSLHVLDRETSATVERSILGGVRSHPDADVTITDSIVDAGETGVAYASTGAPPAGGGPLVVESCTVLGRVRARILQRLSDSIVLAVVPPTEHADWPGPVLADQRQRGCVRFSYLPAGSRTPRRYRCVPATDARAAELRPVLSSARYGDPAYCQLASRTPEAVRRGADDEAEMGVFRHLHQPQREAYLRARLDDYLRFGLEAGLLFAT